MRGIFKEDFTAFFKHQKCGEALAFSTFCNDASIVVFFQGEGQSVWAQIVNDFCKNWIYFVDSISDFCPRYFLAHSAIRGIDDCVIQFINPYFYGLGVIFDR